VLGKFAVICLLVEWRSWKFDAKLLKNGEVERRKGK
jgi:hypothetical protein